MRAVALGLWAFTSSLEATLLLRGRQGKIAHRFPFFYSYIAFLFLSSAVLLPIYLFWPSHYTEAFWFRFMIQLVAEILVEISDQIFSPYLAVRRLGRLLTISLSVTFALVYIFPSLVQAQLASTIALDVVQDVVKRAALAKAIILVSLLATTRKFRLRLGQNVSGIILGFLSYLAVTVINLAVFENYGVALSAKSFSLIGQLGYAISLLIWTIALWREEPASPIVDKSISAEGFSNLVSNRLEKVNSALIKLFGK